MDQTPEDLASAGRSTGSAFRRVGATVVLACVLTGSVAGLGAMGALATPGNSPTEVTASDESSTTEAMDSAKVTYTDAERAAFAASPYAEDAVNLAVIWGTDLEWAEGKAGAKIQAGVPLPFAPGEAATIQYTPDQERAALWLTTVDAHGIVRVAAVWGSEDLPSAKADMGALVLAHQPFPAPPAVFSDDEKARTFRLWGYTDDDAVKLAGLWQTDTHSAILRAGAELLAEHNLPL